MMTALIALQSANLNQVVTIRQDAVRNGHYLIGVILHDSTDGQRFIDAANLLDWGFAHL
jgi:D-alanyl-D-alanine carboxypeptidase